MYEECSYLHSFASDVMLIYIACVRYSTQLKYNTEINSFKQVCNIQQKRQALSSLKIIATIFFFFFFNSKWHLIYK